MIAEFRQGCSTLILADHSPLPPEDRAWLVKNCREWAGPARRPPQTCRGRHPPRIIRLEVDETAHELIAALLDRAHRPA